MPGTTDAADLELAYEFPHPLNARRELSKERVEPDRTNLLWWIKFFTPQNEEVLEMPLARRVFLAAVLRETGERGPVAYNAAFYVDERFRRQQFARSVYVREEDLYRKWGVREIQMEAQRDGLAVWVKSFGFIPKLAGTLEDEYRGWAEKRGLPPHPPEDVSAYPDAFLRERDRLELYKVLR